MVNLGQVGDLRGCWYTEGPAGPLLSGARLHLHRVVDSSRRVEEVTSRAQCRVLAGYGALWGQRSSCRRCCCHAGRIRHAAARGLLCLGLQACQARAGCQGLVQLW